MNDEFEKSWMEGEQPLALADGGMVDKLKGYFSGKPAVKNKTREQEDEIFKPKAPAPAAAPTPPPPADPNNPAGIQFADGGIVDGPGTTTSDSVPARLSDKEAVLPADTVAALGAETVKALIAHTHKPAAGGSAAGGDEFEQNWMKDEPPPAPGPAEAIAKTAQRKASSKATQDEFAKSFGEHEDKKP